MSENHHSGEKKKVIADFERNAIEQDSVFEDAYIESYADLYNRLYDRNLFFVEKR